MSENPEKIGALLRLGALSDTVVQKRAAMLVEDFDWIDFGELRLSASPYPHQDFQTGVVEAVVIPEYEFGDTGFSINNAENAHENRIEWFGGTGLSRGHLQFLSRVSLIGREMLPKRWLICEKLRRDLRNPQKHLSTLEEIWWLGRWIAPQGVAADAKLRSDRNTDVDWRFRLGDHLTVNLEVKRIPSDCIRHTRGRQLAAGWFQRFCAESVVPKFQETPDWEVNVLAITLFGEIDRNVQLTVSEWLLGQNLIDAILLASREGRRKSSFGIQARNDKGKLLGLWLKQNDPEDKSMAFALEVPVRSFLSSQT